MNSAGADKAPGSVAAIARQAEGQATMDFNYPLRGATDIGRLFSSMWSENSDRSGDFREMTVSHSQDCFNSPTARQTTIESDINRIVLAILDYSLRFWSVRCTRLDKISDSIVTDAPSDVVLAKITLTGPYINQLAVDISEVSRDFLPKLS